MLVSPDRMSGIGPGRRSGVSTIGLRCNLEATSSASAI